jgi:hypothetical protein
MVISSHVVAGRAPAVADTGMFRPTSTPTCYEHLNRPGTRGGYRSHCRVAVPLVRSPGVCSTACWRKTISSSMWSAEPVQGAINAVLLASGLAKGGLDECRSS